MTFPILPPLREWGMKALDAIRTKGKDFFGAVREAIQKGISGAKTAVSAKPLTGYSLIYAAKEKEREGVFNALKEASEKGDLIFKAISAKNNEDFCSTLFLLHDILSKPVSSYSETNKQVLSLIRQAVTSDAYKKLCDDENNPAIKYLHRLVIASFIDYKPHTYLLMINSE